MAQRCTICAHPLREETDAVLRGEHNVSQLALQLGTSRQSIIRHRTNHLVGAPAAQLYAEAKRRMDARLEPSDEDDSASTPPPSSLKKPLPKQNVQTAFLTSYAASGDLRQALKDAGVTRTELRRWQEHDEDFLFRFRQAENEAVEHLETEARIRAVAGSKMVRRVYRQGLLYEEIHEWRPSDAMLVKLLQAARPEKYTDKLTVTQTTVVKAVDADAWNSV